METGYSFCFSTFYDKKVLQSGLLIVWFCGVLLVWLSFYAIQLLPVALKEQIGIDNSIGDLSCPKITVFTAPKPFVGSIGERQSVAIRSWLGLSASVDVVLFSQDLSVFSFADSFGTRVSVNSNIDFTFLGTPFFHSMVARVFASSSSSDISAFVDPDTIILPNFFSTMRYAHKLDVDWLLVASPQNISHFLFHSDSDGTDNGNFGEQKLQEHVAWKHSWKPCGDRTIIAWNGRNIPLHKGVLPPFLYGKGLHNHWIITEALASDFRLVIDASWTVSSFYVDYPEEEDISHFENRSWEIHGNSLMGRLYGSFSFRNANYSNLFRTFDCYRNYLLVNTKENIIFPLQNIVVLSKEAILECIDVIRSLEGIEQCIPKEKLKFPSSVSLPLSLESLLAMRADQNKSIVLAVAGYSYMDMLMSWVCRLRHLNVSNFLVCALDDETYNLSVLLGLPVIKSADSPTNISFDNCHFGTECFQRVTKVKSRMVLQILKMGYNVLLSDVDVYWFKNPLAHLSSFGPGVLVAQSDEFKATGAINLPRRLNSGFYYANSDNITIAALEKVVKHAANSNLSEQPSFYDSLCGEGGLYRLSDYECLEPETKLMVHFLNRDLFPNGAYQALWEEEDVREVCLKKGCFILHNNWINGRKKKLERQVLSGLWEYDISTRMCLQSWNTTTTDAVTYF